MEILCLSRERLSLAMTEQENQTRKMVEYFVKNPLNWNRTYHFDISMSSIVPTLNGYWIHCFHYYIVNMFINIHSYLLFRLHPVYWNLKLESSTPLRVARTNAVLARDFFIGHAKKFYVTRKKIFYCSNYLKQIFRNIRPFYIYTADGTLPRGYYLYVHRIAQRKM
jgi:glycosyltransferase involved in cell wall biosynthesis